MRRSGGLTLAVLLSLVLLPLIVLADEPVQDWPEPLTLDFVLARVDQSHPDLQLAEAAVAQARAMQLQAESNYGLHSSLLARLHWIEPSPLAHDPSRQDHRLRLQVSKRLYDFGRTAALEAAAGADLAARQQGYRDALNQYQLAVMAAYFDVLLVDLEVIRDNEAMSIGYVNFDRAQSRNELGQLSDIELLRFESAYQLTRARQYASSSRQRTARQRLANLINRSDRLPAELAAPVLPDVQHDIPDVAAWFAGVEAANPELIALQAAVQAAHERLRAAQASRYPVLNGLAEVSTYSRESGSNDPWRVGINLDVPITTGGETRAQTTQRRAELQAARARLERRRREIREAVLESWSVLHSLRARRQELVVQAEYRDLYLDRSRALYELEIKSDLGDAMTQTSDVRLQQARVDYEITLAWGRVRALLGQDVMFKLD
ncbi:MAG: TolC family protein [Gammaproteobacteria bacterium]|nr:TolC family protein [Gammaproteobacteria bacterium]MCF6361989.1 TolC family protein [Gammaproteobacteria bacterium]